MPIPTTARRRPLAKVKVDAPCWFGCDCAHATEQLVLAVCLSIIVTVHGEMDPADGHGYLGQWSDAPLPQPTPTPAVISPIDALGDL